MRRGLLLLLVVAATGIGCSLFLDSGEFASEDSVPDAGGGSGEGGSTDAGNGGSDSNASTDAPVTSDGGGDAGDDFCTRSFASAKHFTAFDVAAMTGWNRNHCEPIASFATTAADGKPSPSLGIGADAGLPGGSFRVCWLEKDVDVGHIYRWGVDVKLVTADMSGNIELVRLELAMPDANVDYGFNLGHGVQPSFSEERFGFSDGGVQFREQKNLGAASLDWVRYRGELVIVPGGKSKYTVCRDGVKVREIDVAFPLAVPESGYFNIGINYVGDTQPMPVEIRFDNVFLEVVP